VISRLLVQDVLSVSLSYARLRPRGMFVIARRGYLSEFGPKTFISSCSFSLLTQGKILSSPSPSLENSSQLTLLLNQSFQPSCEWRCCMLEALDDLVDCKPTLILSPWFLIFVERSSPTFVSVCACHFCTFKWVL